MLGRGGGRLSAWTCYLYVVCRREFRCWYMRDSCNGCSWGVTCRHMISFVYSNNIVSCNIVSDCSVVSIMPTWYSYSTASSLVGCRGCIFVSTAHMLKLNRLCEVNNLYSTHVGMIFHAVFVVRPPRGSYIVLPLLSLEIPTPEIKSTH